MYLKNSGKFDGKQDWWILLLVNLTTLLLHSWEIFYMNLIEIFTLVDLQAFQVSVSLYFIAYLL